MGDFENISFIVSKMLRRIFFIDRKRDKKQKMKTFSSLVNKSYYTNEPYNITSAS